MMEKAKAKRNVRIMRTDKQFTNFIKGNEYRCMFRINDVVLIDEDRNGFICDIDTFDEEFELVK